MTTLVEPIYTLEEVAERLKVDVQTVRRYVRAKLLKARLLGKTYRVSDSALREFWESLPEEQPNDSASDHD